MEKIIGYAHKNKTNKKLFLSQESPTSCQAYCVYPTTAEAQAAMEKWNSNNLAFGESNFEIVPVIIKY